MSKSDYRFREIKLRVYNKETKKMVFSNREQVAFAINSKGFAVLDLDSEGNILPEPLGDETNSVLMQGSGHRDEKNNDIYEGDVVFMCRRTIKGWLPVVGVVNAKDFTFSVNSGLTHYTFDYADKNLYVLGNIFETSDEDLAKEAQAKLDKFTPDALKKLVEEQKAEAKVVEKKS